MIPRILEEKLKILARSFPALAVMGPRQSGKTTLVRATFPKLPYVSLENLDERAFAETDPRGFLDRYKEGAIFDEIQKVPSLFSYLQQVLDETKLKGHFILTGSQHFLLHEKISQTLAGRIALLKLLPLSIDELKQVQSLPDLNQVLFQGFYPRLYADFMPPADWFAAYLQTYVEKDVRSMKNIGDLSSFQKFLQICAAQTGQLLNLSRIAVDLGISHNTVKSWISVLEESFIIFLIKPHQKNFRKRLTKMPKLYFWDTGLACHLLKIQNPEQLETHFLKGALFENLIVAELMKTAYHRGLEPGLFFWRDQTGHEVDLIIDKGTSYQPVEIKSGKTIQEDWANTLLYWKNLSKQTTLSTVIYGGESSQKRKNIHFLSWKNLENL